MPPSCPCESVRNNSGTHNLFRERTQAPKVRTQGRGSGANNAHHTPWPYGLRLSFRRHHSSNRATRFCTDNAVGGEFLHHRLGRWRQHDADLQLRALYRRRRGSRCHAGSSRPRLHAYGRHVCPEDVFRRRNVHSGFELHACVSRIAHGCRGVQGHWRRGALHHLHSGRRHRIVADRPAGLVGSRSFVSTYGRGGGCSRIYLRLGFGQRQW